VLVDVTHMRTESLRDTFALLDEIDPGKTTPLIASHMACRFGSLAYNLTDDDIRSVAQRGGVLGVIDCRHYTTDAKGHAAQDGSIDESLAAICAHIDHVVEVTGSDDHAAIGTDLDGYIKPALTGLEHEGHMTKLQDALVQRYGIDRARKICSDNALRVLRTMLDR
jgi:microsomal dipeptidase-like Zn-dependent dipeptidase